MSVAVDYREINSLKSQLKELQAKHDTQTLTLANSDDELRRARAEIQKFAKDRATLEQTQKNAVALQQSSNDNTAVRVTLEAKVQQLTSDAAEAQAHVAALETKLATSRETMDILSQAQVQHEQAIGLIQTQLTEALAKGESLQTELDSAQETIAERDASLAAAEHEASKVARFREEMLASERAMGVLRAQMVVAAEQASRKQNELQNALQAARQFLDELRAEYEDYADTTKAEFELYKASKAHEIRQLRMEFDRFKTAQFEDNRQLLVEQQSITHALQTQYEEYRKSVEQIYVVESAKLEDKLHSQMNKYEAEIRFIIKSKDAAYLDMVANKDAKIMNLIEGANMQAVLFRHEMELDQTKKQHDLEMARQRERIESDFKREITQLNKEIQNREMAIDAYKNHADAAGRKLDEAQRNFDKSIKAMEVKEESRQQQLNDLQRQLEVANSQVEKLSQTREQQRHRILRLTMQAQGELGDDVDTVIRRIIHESGRLANELEAVTTKYRFELEDAAALRKQLDIAQSARVIAETELKRRTTDFRKLTDTFEAYLGGKYRTLQRQGLLTPQPATGTNSALDRHTPLPESSSRAKTRSFLSALSAATGQSTGPLLDDMQQDETEVSESARARRKFRLPMKLMMVEEKRAAMSASGTHDAADLDLSLSFGVKALKEFRLLAETHTREDRAKAMAGGKSSMVSLFAASEPTVEALPQQNEDAEGGKSADQQAQPVTKVYDQTPLVIDVKASTSAQQHHDETMSPAHASATKAYRPRPPTQDSPAVVIRPRLRKGTAFNSPIFVAARAAGAASAVSLPQQYRMAPSPAPVPAVTSPAPMKTPAAKLAHTQMQYVATQPNPPQSAISTATSAATPDVTFDDFHDVRELEMHSQQSFENESTVEESQHANDQDEMHSEHEVQPEFNEEEHTDSAHVVEHEHEQGDHDDAQPADEIQHDSPSGGFFEAENAHEHE